MYRFKVVISQDKKLVTLIIGVNADSRQEAIESIKETLDRDCQIISIRQVAYNF